MLDPLLERMDLVARVLLTQFAGQWRFRARTAHRGRTRKKSGDHSCIEEAIIRRIPKCSAKAGELSAIGES